MNLWHWHGDRIEGYQKPSWDPWQAYKPPFCFWRNPLKVFCLRDGEKVNRCYIVVGSMAKIARTLINSNLFCWDILVGMVMDRYGVTTLSSMNFVWQKLRGQHSRKLKLTTFHFLDLFASADFLSSTKFFMLQYYKFKLFYIQFKKNHLKDFFMN